MDLSKEDTQLATKKTNSIKISMSLKLCLTSKSRFLKITMTRHLLLVSSIDSQLMENKAYSKWSNSIWIRSIKIKRRSKKGSKAMVNLIRIGSSIKRFWMKSRLRESGNWNNLNRIRYRAFSQRIISWRIKSQSSISSH